ncbi:MAG: MaoC/PaaZ C-terminal domain-containing protein [Georgfuchsia sp.]
MPLHYENLKSHEFPELTQTYTERDSMLYALGIGMGSDPMDTKQLRFVYEKNQQAVPTMPVVMTHPGLWPKEPKFGIDWVKVVHGEQWLEVHKPLPPKGRVRTRMRNTNVIDKGAGKGAIVLHQREMFDDETGDKLATLAWVLFARGDGGWLDLPHNQGKQSDPPLPSLPKTPEDRAPDIVCDLATLPQQALIYRHNGDWNPLHVDPDLARAAQFPRPILQGLCTYGIACHAILKSLCDYDASRFGGISVRFSSPVYPGDTIRTEMWKQNDGKIQFRSLAVERDVVVLNNGVATLR